MSQHARDLLARVGTLRTRATADHALEAAGSRRVQWREQLSPALVTTVLHNSDLRIGLGAGSVSRSMPGSV